MNMTDEKRKKVIAKLLKTPAGRQRLAAEMNEPLKKFRDYEAIGRRALVVDSLARGELPYYDKDLDTTAIVIGEDGTSIRQIASHIDRVFVPLFEIATYVEIPVTKMAQRRYDLEARVEQKTKSDVFRKEDEKIFSILVSAATNPNAENPEIPLPASNIDYDSISDAMGLVERHGSNRVANIFINGRNISILRKALKDVFDPVTVSEVIGNGIVGHFNGAVVNVSPSVPENYILFTAEKDFTGRLVTSVDLTVMSSDDPKNRSIGYSVFESIGIFVQGHAVAAIKIV